MEDRFDAVDPDGSGWRLTIALADPTSCTAGAGHAVPGLVLMQCLPKARKMDLIIRQAVEAGVERVVRLVSDHAVARADEEHPRAERSRRREGTAVFFHEDRAGAEPLHEMLAETDGPVTVLVGPEGGLSPRETVLLEAAGFRRAWLGDGVLRAETAALYALATVATILRERKTWKPSREG